VHAVGHGPGGGLDGGRGGGSSRHAQNGVHKLIEGDPAYAVRHGPGPGGGVGLSSGGGSGGGGGGGGGGDGGGGGGGGGASGEGGGGDGGFDGGEELILDPHKRGLRSASSESFFSDVIQSEKRTPSPSNPSTQRPATLALSSANRAHLLSHPLRTPPSRTPSGGARHIKAVVYAFMLRALSDSAGGAEDAALVSGMARALGALIELDVSESARLEETLARFNRPWWQRVNSASLESLGGTLSGGASAAMEV